LTERSNKVLKGSPKATIVRFGVFEADLETGELRRAGIRIKLQAQPFRLLAMLLERPGELITRDEIVEALWGDETFVDFDQSVGAVVRKLRQALGDSATAPRYIETLRHRGYRFLAPVQGVHDAEPADSSSDKQLTWTRRVSGLTSAVAIAFAWMAWSAYSSGSTRPAPAAGDERTSERTRHPDAYLAYEKGRYLWRRRTAETVERSIAYFEQAVALDPEYAAAHAGLADAYAILNFYTGRQRTDWIDRARSSSRRALQLDGTLAQAHATQAYIKFYYEWDWPGAESAFQKAIAFDPNCATARQWYAEYLFYMGRFEEALREIGRAQELDPQSVVINLQQASPYMYSRRYGEAMEKIKEGLRLDPDSTLGIYMLATCHEQLGNYQAAIAEYRKIASTKMGLTGLGYAYGRSGRNREAREILESLLGEAKRDDLSAYHVARVYAGLGDADEALTWLRQAQEARDERLVMVKVDPKLDQLRSTPVFRDLLRSLGLA
jgi:DNA-binding winged helix-turn-helix (wHTH) protein/Tfp pilus assembly protein PilF